RSIPSTASHHGGATPARRCRGDNTRRPRRRRAAPACRSSCRSPRRRTSPAPLGGARLRSAATATSLSRSGCRESRCRAQGRGSPATRPVSTELVAEALRRSVLLRLQAVLRRPRMGLVLAYVAPPPPERPRDARAPPPLAR